MPRALVAQELLLPSSLSAQARCSSLSPRTDIASSTSTHKQATMGFFSSRPKEWSSYRAAQAGSLPAHHHHHLEASAASPYASPLAAHGTDAHHLRELQALSARMQAMQGERGQLRDGLYLQNRAGASASPGGAPVQRRASMPASPRWTSSSQHTAQFQQTRAGPPSPFLANSNVLSATSAARRAVYGQGRAAGPPSPVFPAAGGGSDAHLDLHNMLREGVHAHARARASTVPSALPASPRRADHSQAPLSAASADANANAAGMGPGPCPFDAAGHRLASPSQPPLADHGVFSAPSPAPAPFSSPAFGISDPSQIPAHCGSGPAVARSSAGLDANGFPAMPQMPHPPSQAGPAPNAHIHTHTQASGPSYAVPFDPFQNTPRDVFGGPAYQFPTPFAGGMRVGSGSMGMAGGAGQQSEHPAFRAGFGVGMGLQHHHGFGVGHPSMAVQPGMGASGGIYPGQGYQPHGQGIAMSMSTASSHHPGHSLFA